MPRPAARAIFWTIQCSTHTISSLYFFSTSSHDLHPISRQLINPPSTSPSIFQNYFRIFLCGNIAPSVCDEEMRDEPGQWNNSKSLALVEDNVEPPRLPSITADHSIRRRRYCHVHGTYQPLPAVVITTSSHQAITTNCPFGVCFFFWNLALKLLCNTCPLLSLNKSAPPAIISFFFFLIPWSWQFCSSSTLIESHKIVTKDSSNSWVGLIVSDFLDHYAVKVAKYIWQIDISSLVKHTGQKQIALRFSIIVFVLHCLSRLFFLL